MKILLITLRADHGGGPQHINLLIKNLSNNFNIFVACPEDKPYYEKWNVETKVKNIFELPHRQFKLRKFLELYNFIKENDITIIHSHGKGAGLYSRLLKLINPKLKVIHTLHGFHIQEYSFIKRKVYILIEKILSLMTNTFINVSYGEQKICLDFGIYKKNKSIVVHNGISKITHVINAKQKIGLKDKFIITTISRFDYAKNMLFAYEIAKQFKNNDQIVFLWIGDGEDKMELEEKAKEENINIVFTGFKKEIPLYLSATDIYLSTSRWEGLPYALIEAQSLNIPIVATNVVGNNEVVVNNKNGFLFTTLKESVQQMNTLVKDVNLYNKFKNFSEIHFESKFSINVLIEHTENIYNKVNNE